MVRLGPCVAETGWLCKLASGTATPDWWRMEKSKLLDKKAVEFQIAPAAHDLLIFDTDLQMSLWKFKLHIATRIPLHLFQEQSKREKAMEEEMKQIEAKEVLYLCRLWMPLHEKCNMQT